MVEHAYGHTCTHCPSVGLYMYTYVHVHTYVTFVLAFGYVCYVNIHAYICLSESQSVIICLHAPRCKFKMFVVMINNHWLQCMCTMVDQPYIPCLPLILLLFTRHRYQPQQVGSHMEACFGTRHNKAAAEWCWKHSPMSMHVRLAKGNHQRISSASSWREVPAMTISFVGAFQPNTPPTEPPPPPAPPPPGK